MKNTIKKMLKSAKKIAKGELSVFENVLKNANDVVISNEKISFTDSKLITYMYDTTNQIEQFEKSLISQSFKSDSDISDYPIVHKYNVNDFKNIFTLSGRDFKTFITDVENYTAKYLFDSRSKYACVSIIDNILFATNSHQIFELTLKTIKIDGRVNLIFPVKKIKHLKDLIDFSHEITIGVSDDVVVFDNGFQQLVIKTDKELEPFNLNGFANMSIDGFGYFSENITNGKHCTKVLSDIVKTTKTIDNQIIEFDAEKINYTNDDGSFIEIENFIKPSYKCYFNINAKLLFDIFKSINLNKLNIKYKDRYDIICISSEQSSIRLYVMPLRRNFNRL